MRSVCPIQLTHTIRDLYYYEAEPNNPSKLLAVRTVLGVQGHARLFSFWLFTLLGLTVPYRIWFNGHCDDANFLIVKEVA